MMKSSEICGESTVETSKHFKKFQVTMSSALRKIVNYYKLYISQESTIRSLTCKWYKLKKTIRDF